LILEFFRAYLYRHHSWHHRTRYAYNARVTSAAKIMVSLLVQQEKLHAERQVA